MFYLSQGAVGQAGTRGGRGLDGPPVGNLFFSYSRNKLCCHKFQIHNGETPFTSSHLIYRTASKELNFLPFVCFQGPKGELGPDGRPGPPGHIVS